MNIQSWLCSNVQFIRNSSLSALPRHVADRVRVQQMNMLAYLTRIMALAGLNTLLLLAVGFWSGPLSRGFIAGLICLPAIYAVVIYKARVWGKISDPLLQAVGAIRTQSRLILAVGIAWGLLLIGMTAIADPDQRTLVYPVGIGIISTAVLYAPLSAALSLWIPVSMGAFLALLLPGRPMDHLVLGCLGGYLVLTFFCIIYLNRKFIERVVHEIQLEEQSEVISLLLRDFEESSSDWLWETDESLRLRHVSGRFADVARRPAELLRGASLLSVVGLPGTSSERMREGALRLASRLSDRIAFRDLVLQVVVGTEERWWCLSGRPNFDKLGRFTGYRGVGSDVTAAKRSEERITYLARYDSLTDLPNRVLFGEMLAQACERAEREAVALLCLDLDEFKSVNDRFGHATGDALLLAVAQRLRRSLRSGGMAARLGGDEFAVLCPARDQREVEACAARLVSQLNQPFQLEGLAVEIGVSIGIAMAPADGIIPAELLKKADMALYRAKSEGRGAWRYFDRAMDDRLNLQRTLRADLRHALDRGELELQFQPVVDLLDLRVEACEALLRWRHPGRGLIPPNDFIPAAEASGQIIPIGAWAIGEACRQAARWPRPIRVAVNLSPAQLLRNQNLIKVVDDALAESGLSSDRLELEITESVFLERNEHTLSVLHQLRARGVRIALDDFGTGYSGLGYLLSFPFDKLKIDRSFTADLGRNKDGNAIVKLIINMAETLGMTVIAEGVETVEQARLLKAFGCRQVQGFLFSRPLNTTDIGRFLLANRTVDPALLADVDAAADTPVDAAPAAAAALGRPLA